MKIVATIKGCGQVGQDLFEDYQISYIFNSTDSIQNMLEKTGAKHLSALNLSEVIEDKREESE